MSNFKCTTCGAVIIDSPNGYITGCEHFPLKPKEEVGRRGRIPNQKHPPVAPETIARIVELFPTTTNDDIASELHISRRYLDRLVAEMRRQGISLEKRNRETNAIMKVSISDYITNRNKKNGESKVKDPLEGKHEVTPENN